MKSSKTSFLKNCISGWNVRRATVSLRNTSHSEIYCTFALTINLRDSWLWMHSRRTAIPRRCYAEIAQLVEHQLPKLRVASSSLVFRSN